MPVKCSFCEKSKREVAKLVAAATGTAICDECLVVAFAKMAGSKIQFVSNPGARVPQRCL